MCPGRRVMSLPGGSMKSGSLFGSQHFSHVHNHNWILVVELLTKPARKLLPCKAFGHSLPGPPH